MLQLVVAVILFAILLHWLVSTVLQLTPQPEGLVDRRCDASSPYRPPPPIRSRLTHNGLVGTVAMGPAAKVETAPPQTEGTNQKI